MNGAMSKTPAAKTNKTRRALGDISNRKGQNSSNSIFGGAGKAINIKKAPVPNSHRLFSHQNQQHQQQRSTKASVVATSKRSEVSFLPRSSTAPPIAIFPDTKNTKSEVLLAPKSILKSRQEDVVDDIEIAAGRLWVDQQDDIEDRSVGSLSLPGAATFMEDYKAAVRKSHAARLKNNLEEEKREKIAFEAYEKKLLEEEGKSWSHHFLCLHAYRKSSALWRTIKLCVSNQTHAFILNYFR